MNDESSKVTGKSLPFSEITTPTELIAYLDSSERLKSRKFLYHYIQNISQSYTVYFFS